MYISKIKISTSKVYWYINWYTYILVQMGRLPIGCLTLSHNSELLPCTTQVSSQNLHFLQWTTLPWCLLLAYLGADSPLLSTFTEVFLSWMALFSSCSILYYLIASKCLNSSPLSITENKVGQELSFISEDKGESSFSEEYKVSISCLMTVVTILSYLNMELVSPLPLKTCLEYLNVNAEFLSQKGKAWDGISESCATTLKNVSMVAEELHFLVEDTLLHMECMQHASWTWWQLIITRQLIGVMTVEMSCWMFLHTCRYMCCCSVAVNSFLC